MISTIRLQYDGSTSVIAWAFRSFPFAEQKFLRDFPMHLRVGTSGFSYKEWKGSFYPQDLPGAEMLAYYAERFSAVEINSTFYRLPSEEGLRQWADAVPAGFTFSFKAPQVITHRKRLREVDDVTAEFLRVTGVLNGRLGPLLVQLPPNFKKDLPRLEAFLRLLPAETRIAFGFRNPSWFDDDVIDMLRDHGRSLCIEQDQERTTPLLQTASWGYVRLRRGIYDDSDLSDWADRIRDQGWSEVYVFFMHEDTGTGPRFARRFEEVFRQS
jgi:uncharacterized protein YecE (DUF72 family)